MTSLLQNEVHSKKVDDKLCLAKAQTETVKIVSICNAGREKCSLKLLGTFTRASGKSCKGSEILGSCCIFTGCKLGRTFTN